MLKIGIVGVRGLSTLMGFRAIPGVEVTALCDLDDELLRSQCAQYGIKQGYRVFDDMLDADIDAVVVSTPMQCHVPQSIMALQAGKHVLSEVTAGVSMEELWWLIDAVEKSGKTYMMAENYCYIPDNQLILNMVRSGVLGDVYYGEGEYLHNLISIMTYDYGLQHSGKPSWRQYWQMGRRGAYYPTHSLGPVMQWFPGDRVASVACFGTGRHHGTGYMQEDTNVTMCQLASGGLVRVRLDALSPRPHQMTYYSIQGTKGVVESSRFVGEGAKIWLTEYGESVDHAAWRPLSSMNEYLPARYKSAAQDQLNAGHGGGDFFIIEDFINAVRGIGENPIDVYTACEWTAVGLLSELSITNGSRVMDVPHFRKNMPFIEKRTTI